MALVLNNFVGFETGDYEECIASYGAPIIGEATPHAGDYYMAMAGDDGVDVAMITGGTSSQGDDMIVGLALRRTDAPSDDRDFFFAYDDDDNLLWKLVAKTNDKIEAYDSANTLLGTSTSTIADTPAWSYVEIRWQHVNSGDFDLWMDGGSEFSYATADCFQASTLSENDAYYRLMPETGTMVGYHYDCLYMMSGASGTGDFLGESEVFKYQSVKASDTPDTGDVLDAGTWDKAGETPLAATATNPEYTDTGAGSVDTNAANGFPEGPKNDARIDGDSNIRGMKGVSNMKRSGGGGTAHYILMGNDVDGTTRSVDIDPTAAFVTYFFISELASIVPLSTEYCSIGFEMDNAQDYECQEQWAMLLHVPSVGPGAGELESAARQAGELQPQFLSPEVIAY